jgi:DNA-binding transcriptional MocR family regulator
LTKVLVTGNANRTPAGLSGTCGQISQYGMMWSSMIRLDASSDVPLYRQLSRHFIDRIESGQLQAGERLPATRELAGQLGLNRTTIAAAYELLESEGWISGEVGRGSFVRARTFGNSRKSISWNDFMPQGASPRRFGAPPTGSLISFATSRPSEQLFPLDAFRASCDEVLRSPVLSGILQLGSPGGYEPLRQYLLEEARTEGVAGPNDDVMVTNGCQQALDLLCRVLVRPGDPVAVEDPVYPGLRNLFREAGADLTGFAVGQTDSIARYRPKLIIVTPNFQNPTGETLSMPAREAILRVPGAVIIENDIYGALRYEGTALPTLKQLDETGGTILIRSFSKIAFPGLRVGWIIGPRPVVQRLMEAKQLTDLHTDQFSQAALLQFARSGRLQEHQRNMLSAGAERLRTILRSCERFLPAGSKYSRPQGGMNLWVELPEHMDSGDLLARAQAAGVTYLPGRHFEVSRNHSNALRLSFAGLANDKIQEGMALLGEVFSNEYAPQPAEAMV